MTAKKPLLAADSGIHLSPQSDEADDIVSSRSPEMSPFAKDSLDQNDLNQSAYANTSPPSPRVRLDFESTFCFLDMVLFQHCPSPNYEMLSA